MESGRRYADTDGDSSPSSGCSSLRWFVPGAHPLDTAAIDDLRALTDAWRRSTAFERLAARTKRDYLEAKLRIDERWGACPIHVMEDPRIRPVLLDWRDEMGRQSRRQADSIFGVLRLILEWGRNRGFLASNHATRPKKLYRADRSDKVWRAEHLEAFRAVASPEIRLALELALWTGQRQGDLLRLRWSNFDGSRLKLKQGKRGRIVDMPVARSLRQLLSGVERTAPTILTAPNGQPWRTEPRPTYFLHLWRRTTLAAGLDGLHFHDLRGTTCTALAEAGPPHRRLRRCSDGQRRRSIRCSTPTKR